MPLSGPEIRRHQQWCDEQRKRILSIIKSKGYFDVSWRYRDDRLMTLCYKMVKKGLIRCEYDFRGSARFIAAKNGVPNAKRD